MSDEPSSPSPNVPTRPLARPVQPPAASLFIQRGAQAGEEIPLQPGVNLFGREEGFILRDARISRRHAQIQDIGGEYMLIDLHSTNGSYINGERVVQPTALQHGDIIRLGDTILMLRIEGEGKHDPKVTGARTAELPQERLNETTLLAGKMPPQNAITKLPARIPKSKKSPPEKTPKSSVD